MDARNYVVTNSTSGETRTFETTAEADFSLLSLGLSSWIAARDNWQAFHRRVSGTVMTGCGIGPTSVKTRTSPSGSATANIDRHTNRDRALRDGLR